MTHRHAIAPRRALDALLALLLLVAALLPACGGGVGTGGTGSYGAAPVDGFGSVFVGGIEFDTSGATLLDDDGAPLGGGEGGVRLGMTVEVEGGAVNEGATGPAAKAGVLRLARAVVGPVAGSDVGARRFTLLGQEVQVNGSTVFDASLRGGLAALKPGDVVAVHALADVSGRPVATRVEPAAASEAWRLRGFVAGLDAAAKRFRIGSAVLDYASAANVPTGLADGQLVGVTLSGANGGVLEVAAFGRLSALPTEAARADVEGLVGPIGASGRIAVNGVAVDVAAARIDPSPAALIAGAQARIEGRVERGTLVAGTVEVLSADEVEHRIYRLAGTIDTLDLAAATLSLRGVAVDFAAAHFVGGSPATLAVGVALRVQGRLSADGTRLEATQVQFR